MAGPDWLQAAMGLIVRRAIKPPDSCDSGPKLRVEEDDRNDGRDEEKSQNQRIENNE